MMARLQARIVAPLVLVLVTLLGGVAAMQWQQREKALDDAARNVQNLAQVIEAQVRGNVQAVDISLIGLARTLPLLSGTPRPGDSAIHALLRTSLANLPFVRAIWVTNAAGDMVHDTDQLAGHLNFSKRAYFTEQRDKPGLGLYLGPPIVNAAGVWFMSASRRIENADGSFAGVVVAAIEPRYFDRFFSSVHVGETGVVALLTTESVLVARVPTLPQSIGRVVDHKIPLRFSLQQSASPIVRKVSPVDGLERIVAFRQVDKQPLVVVVGLGEAETLAAWRSASWAIGAAAVTLCALIVALAYMVWRALSRSRAFNKSLRTSSDLLEYSQAAAKVGGWELTLATGQLFWTAETYRIHETTPQEFNPTVDAGVGYFLPESRSLITAALQAAIERGEGYDLELETYTTKGNLITVRTTCTVTLDKGKPVALTGIFQDITASRQSLCALETVNRDLARSNAELEQFAYVASHDLQEPLRSISSCVQLLKMRYQTRLDARADEFIAHAVGGTQRMQALIDDLLAFSRIGAVPPPLTEVASAAVLQTVLANLDSALAESNASMTCDPLPTVHANAGQLAQLFQNLVGNALKFRGGRSAVVHIGVRRDATEWVFSVADQGIGIAPEHFERIFGLFKRLHSREEYAGTGIGLTICKRIVEHHGGRIWVESAPGQGTTFFFTLPVTL